jgi:ElaB/YqjD/DUF883 family membrane-anchored ribosome-binding protein
MKDMKDMKSGIDRPHTADEWITGTGEHARVVEKKMEESKPAGMVDTVKESLQGAATCASELASKATETAKDWAGSVGNAAVQAKDSTQEALSAAADKAGDAGKEVIALIRRYPLQSALVGIAAGYLAGKLVRRNVTGD